MSFDRRAAFLLWIAVATGLAATAVISDSPAVPAGEPRNDPRAFAELTRLLDASEEGDWLVEYRYTRTRAAGDSVTSPVTEARRDGVHVVRGPTSAETENGERAFRCQITGEAVSCLPVPVAETLRTAEVLRTLVDRGVYVVSSLPAETVSGERAQCFRVFGTRGFLPDLGIEREYCFSDDAVPLRTRVVDANVSDELVAVRVVREPGAAALDALLEGLETAATRGEG